MEQTDRYDQLVTEWVQSRGPMSLQAFLNAYITQLEAKVRNLETFVTKRLQDDAPLPSFVVPGPDDGVSGTA